VTSITVLRPGAAATVQDLGRPGYAHLGVSRSGATDFTNHRRANRFVGNAEGAGTIELLLGGFAATLDVSRWCAVTGAPGAVTVDGLAVRDRALFLVPAGSRIDIAVASAGVRSYLAIAGGVLGTPVLGSASWDSLASHGTAPARSGTVWPLGEPAGDPPFSQHDVGIDPSTPLLLRFVWGPRDGLLAEADRRSLTGTPWTVDALSDRVGSRLTGRRIALAAGALPSEGCVRGSIQVPPSGEPIVFLSDHPVTGGYPVVGVVDPGDCDRLAQARPGTGVVLVATG
jgi:biotin-dependent carboxylase-like uncharacterized protein